MTWFRIDDGFYDHPKVEDLEPSAVGLWTLCGTYAARHLTDGFVAKARVRRFGGTDDDVQALLDAGLWVQVEGGYQFHDWTDHQPTREDVEAKRAEWRARKQGQRRGEGGQYAGRTKGNVSRVSNVDTHVDSTQDSLVDSTVESHESHASVQRGVSPSRPVPSRPVPEVPKGTSSEDTRKKPATTLPESWAPTDAHRAKAVEKRLDLACEAEAFKLHAETNDRRAANWNAAFSMWLTKANPRTQQYTPARPVVGQAGNWMNLSRKAPQ